MRFIIILLSFLFFSASVVLSDHKVEKKSNCLALKKTSTKYISCKAKQVGGWFKKKAKAGGKKISETKPGKSFKKFKEKKTLME